MYVIDLHGFSDDAIVGPEHGATRIFIWCTTAVAGHVVGLHYHQGEEISRVLYGRLRFRVGDEVREVGAGEVVIIPPGVDHAYRVLEDAAIESYGEIGSGIFSRIRQLDGSYEAQEVYVREVPWSRVPPPGKAYVSREDQLRRFRQQAQDEQII